MSDSRQFAKSSNLVARQVGEETILVPVQSHVGKLEGVYTLTPVAAKVWQCLDGVQTVDQIVVQICSEYEVTKETAAADLAELVESLAVAGLVEERGR